MTEEKKDNIKKPDEAILFPELKVKIKGVEHEIKPWTLGKLLEVNPILESIFDRLEKKDTKIDLTNIDMATVKNIYFAAMPQVVELIKSSTVLSEEEIKELSLQDALSLIMTIFSANMGSLNSFLSLFFAPNQKESPEEEVKGQD